MRKGLTLSIGIACGLLLLVLAWQAVYAASHQSSATAGWTNREGQLEFVHLVYTDTVPDWRLFLDLRVLCDGTPMATRTIATGVGSFSAPGDGVITVTASSWQWETDDFPPVACQELIRMRWSAAGQADIYGRYDEEGTRAMGDNYWLMDVFTGTQVGIYLPVIVKQ